MNRWLNKIRLDLGGVKLDLKLIGDVFFVAGAGLTVYYILNIMLNEHVDNPLKNRDSEKKSKGILKKIQSGNPHLKNVTFTQYEKALLNSLISPDDIEVSFEDIGGLEDIIDEIRETVILPLIQPELFSTHSKLIRSPKGVLFHGPPGCGKTMLAKAIAQESGAFFLSIRMSTIMDKWYGESNKIADAIFSLANKLEPCIIFIDEIDSFLRDRSSNEHEASAMLKAEFMTLWDGLQSNGRIMVMGATNRLVDIDAAFLRRLPKTFAVKRPGGEQRKAILQKFLKGTSIDKDDFDLDYIVACTAGSSGSDLQELCREAAILPVREYIKENYNFKSGKLSKTNMNELDVRPLRTSDFLRFSNPKIESATVD